MESGSLEERKEFIRAFIDGIMVKADESRLVVYMKKLPTTKKPWPGDDVEAFHRGDEEAEDRRRGTGPLDRFILSTI